MANLHNSHLSHINPAYDAVGSCDTEEEVEFDFWPLRKAHHFNSCRERSKGCETQLKPQFGEYFDDHSTLLWKASPPTNFKHECSPLLPNKHHHYSEVFTRPSSQVIAEGRRELMEMISDLPENSVELSLKDIVDEKNVLQGGKEDVAVHETDFDFNTEDPVQKHNIRKTNNISRSFNQVSRSGSMMKKERFLIKMFIPKTLSWKKKLEAKHGFKVSPAPFIEPSSENHEHKKGWIQRFLAIGGSKTGSSIDTNSSANSLCRHSDSYQGCWPVLGGKTSKKQKA